MGRLFLGALCNNLEGVIDQRWNTERFIAFQRVILQQNREVTGAEAIKRYIDIRMEAWQNGKFWMLVEDTERCAESYLSNAWGDMDDEGRAKVFNRLLL